VTYDFLKPSLFQDEMNRLGAMFTPLDAAKMDIYYDEFRAVHIATIREAVRVLIGQHPYRRFPLPNEIWSAIAAVRKKAAARKYAQDAREQLGVCGTCLGMGWKKIPDKFIEGIPYSYVTFCDCRLGQRMRAAFEYKRRTAERENPKLTYQDVPGVVPDPADAPPIEDEFMKEEQNDDESERKD